MSATDQNHGTNHLATILCHSCRSEIHTAERVELKQLRAGHYVPSAVEQVDISNYLVDAERDIRLYSQEIDRVSAILDSLQSQRQVRRNDTLIFRGALSPIRRVPMELWKQIFAQCLDGSPQDIYLTETFSAASFRAHRRLSKDTPLAIQFRVPSGDCQSDDDIVTALQEVFSKTKTVMKQLSVTELLDLDWGPLKYVLAEIPTSLKSVKVSLSASYRPKFYNSTLFGCFWSHPTLRHIDLPRVHNNWNSELVQCWENLRTARLSFCSMSVIDDFLSKASKLKSMNISRISLPFTTIPSVSASLQHFSVRSSGDAIGLLLAHITLPTVKSISIIVEYLLAPDALPAENLERFFSSCSLTLRTLSLQQVVIDDHSLLVILQSLPHLRDFTFYPESVTESSSLKCIRGDIYRQMKAYAICPALEMLDITVTPNVMDTLMNLLASRVKGLIRCEVQLLAYKNSRISRKLASSFYQRAALLRREGLVVKASHYPTALTEDISEELQLQEEEESILSEDE
ncbi:hypothetical protein C8J56DRAFT_1049165 [Mycena floridula]|nr:hypothetical protein C8J56DRAFT_1049165 [Mycena floridula]